MDKVVLILVLLEDALRPLKYCIPIRIRVMVLILVLLEDALRHQTTIRTDEQEVSVLILVLLEDALRRVKTLTTGSISLCLNPCFTGRCSKALEFFFDCFNEELS